MVCSYVYNMEKQEAKATTVEVQFDKHCADETQKVCPKQKYGGYGHQGHCKEVNNEVRLNFILFIIITFNKSDLL